MCLGYGEDFEQVTELFWKDDKNLDFYDLGVRHLAQRMYTFVCRRHHIGASATASVRKSAGDMALSPELSMPGLGSWLNL